MGTAVVAGMAVRTLLKVGWRAIRAEDPPLNPAAPSTDWSEALSWTVAIGVAVGVGRLVARRGAAAGWKKATGDYPPGLEGM